MYFGCPIRKIAFLLLAYSTLFELALAAIAPVPVPVPAAPRSSTTSKFQTIENYLLPTQQVVQELQSGFSRLNRMCSYGSATSQPDSKELDFLASQLSMARNQLFDVQSKIDLALTEFRQKSSLATASYCRFVPEFSLVGLTCQAYRQDAIKVASVVRIADQLTADAALRIDLYEKYLQLEARGCTRTGFAQKLWQKEQSLLWPLVLQSPEFFKLQLVPTR